MKVFLVIVMNCENRSHARKIARLLRAFPHRDYGTTDAQYGTTDTPSIRVSAMVTADSVGSIQTAIAPGLGKAKAAIGEMSFVSDDKVSSEPFDFLRFKPPTRSGSTQDTLIPRDRGRTTEKP